MVDDSSLCTLTSIRIRLLSTQTSDARKAKANQLELLVNNGGDCYNWSFWRFLRFLRIMELLE
jgi:hypothetical protein